MKPKKGHVLEFYGEEPTHKEALQRHSGGKDWRLHTRIL